MLHPILKSAKSGHDMFDVDLDVFDMRRGKWRDRSF